MYDNLKDFDCDALVVCVDYMLLHLYCVLLLLLLDNVHQIFLEALKETALKSLVLGYRVWDKGYAPGDCYIKVCFDDEAMNEKEKLIKFYDSQIVDPAYPHERYSFTELVKIMNKKEARRVCARLPYVECYKKII